MVTLNQASGSDTTIFLGAQLEPSGSAFFPKPSVIVNLPAKLVIPAGQLSASFSALAQNVGPGSPYNVQWYAFQGHGKQAVWDMTVPGQ